MVTETIRTESDPDKYHIPGLYSQATMCGNVDVGYDVTDYDDHPVNCCQCINTVKEIKKMRFPKGYFET